MNTTSRTTSILKYILKKKSVNIKKISEYFNLSPRIIRYELDCIEYLLTLKSKTLKLKKLKGEIVFELGNFSSELLIEFFKNFEKASKEEREDYILLNFLIFDELNLTKLSECFEVSRTTIKKDLEHIKKILLEHHLELLYKNNYSIKGDEKYIRLLAAKIIKKYILFLESEDLESYFLKKLSLIFDNQILTAAKKFTSNLFSLKENNFYEVFSFIFISILRKEKIYEYNPEINFVNKTNEFKSISVLSPNFDEKEKIFLADFIIDKKYPCLKKISENIDNIKDKIEVISSEILKISSINVLPSSFPFLTEGFKISLYQTLSLSSFPQQISDNFSKKIIEILDEIEDTIDHFFNDNEKIIFLNFFKKFLLKEIPHLGKNIYLLHHKDFIYENFIKHELKKLYPSFEFKIISYDELIEVNHKDIRLIISFTDFLVPEFISFVPHLKISHLLYQEDIDKLKDFLWIFPQNKLNFSTFLSTNNIHYISNESIDENIKKIIEGKFPSFYYRGFSLTYSEAPNENSEISFIKLKNSEKNIFFFKGVDKLENAISDIFHLIEDKEFTKALSKTCSKNDLINLFSYFS